MSSLPLITSALPLAKVLRCTHLGLAVSNMATSMDFFDKIGFSLETNSEPSVTVLRNIGGFELHLYQCDKGVEDEKNILMDFPVNKYPGHTHAAIPVPDVASMRPYFESVGVKVSGERHMGPRLASVFVRDPDLTTFEFENNTGGQPEAMEITRDIVSSAQSIDHVGIRVSNAVNAWQWYAEKLGFVQEVMKYEHNAQDVLKNGIPWISRTITGVDVNFLLNANEHVSENVLLAGGVTRPGIVYAAYTVADIAAAETALRGAGVSVTRDEDLHTAPTEVRHLADKIHAYPAGKSVFLQDGDRNVLRLVEEED